ncbi:hypothetical protein MLD38_031642 [Melastoma candidum]|uniref:Uncharacterized protein n=1 Tax=Melastoma candidum TaxID=119954 RepID=A0ACB9MQC2_9MYRT|nr:hypothetical protein MLD38_031642 [Melastoma candidum]
MTPYAVAAVPSATPKLPLPFFPPSPIIPDSTSKPSFSVLASPACVIGAGSSRLVVRAGASPFATEGGSDQELRGVLELASDSELFELERILFGPSYFSPLLKSVSGRTDVEYALISDDLEQREDFLAALESRFLYLAADARSVLRGWRPSYRSVLLSVRQKLNIACSSKLSTEDLEAEIFLHLLQDCLREESSTSALWKSPKVSNEAHCMELGFDDQKVQANAASKIGVGEIQSLIFKGGSMLTLSKIYHLVGHKLTGRVFLEAANYQIKKEVIKKGGQLAAINLESRAALLAAKQGFARAASRYLGFRSLTSLLGPVLWGTFLADVFIQMLGTDYARVVRAIFALAQIRITRTYSVSDE